MILRKQSAEDFLLLLVVLSSAQGNIIAISDFFLVFILGFALYLFRKKNLIIQRNFFLFTLAYVLITFIYYVKFGWINPTSSLRVYLKILTAYLTICTIGNSFFKKFETIIFRFALISLPLFAIQIIAYDELKKIIGIAEELLPILNYRSEWYVNLVFFTLNDDAILRNSGFCWEPKGFANLLCIALFFNLMLFNFKFNMRTLILFLALLTTFSTVGYIILILCIGGYYVINQNARFVFFLIPAFFLASYIITKQEFVLNKILNEYNERDLYLDYVTTEFEQEAVSLGRFGSLLVDLKDFPKNPLLGVGMQDSERTQGQYTYLVRVNGLSETLSRFGLAGIAFLVITIFLSAKRLFKLHKTRGSAFYALSFFIIYFGSAVTLSLVFLILQLYCFPKWRTEAQSVNSRHVNSYNYSRA